MAKLYNLAAMTVASTGTGPITLGTAATIGGVLYLAFAAAGAVNGETIAYSINDFGQSEQGTAVYSSVGPTITRTPVTSTNGNNPINVTGAAIVRISPARADIANLRENNVFTGTMSIGGTLAVTGATTLTGLAVNSASNSVATFTKTGGATNSFIGFSDGSGSQVTWGGDGGGNTLWSVAASKQFRFFVGGFGDAMTVSSVGVTITGTLAVTGTTTLTGRAAINGGTTFANAQSLSWKSTAGVDGGLGTGMVLYSDDNLYISNNIAGGQIFLRTGAGPATRLSIDGAGNSTFTGTLAIAGTTTLTGVATFSSGGNFLKHTAPGSGFWYDTSTTAARFFVGGDNGPDNWRIYAAGIANNAFMVSGATGAVTIPTTLAVTGTTTLSGGSNVFGPTGNNVVAWRTQGGSGHLELWSYFNFGGNDYGAYFRSLDSTETSYKPLSFTASVINLLNDTTVGGTLAVTGATTLTGIVSVGGTQTNDKFTVLGNDSVMSVRGSTTAGLVWVSAQASDYYSGPSFSSASIRQYGSTATGTTCGYSNASLGQLWFQNAVGLIGTNGNPIVFGVGASVVAMLQAVNTPSVSPTTGTLTVVGGVGITGAVNIGGTLAVTGSATFTGSAFAPTAAVGTNTTQIATTAFVLANAVTPTSAAFTVKGNRTGATAATADLVSPILTSAQFGFTTTPNGTRIDARDSTLTNNVAVYMETRRSGSSVSNDNATIINSVTADNVDVGTFRSVSQNFGTANGFPASTKGALTRAIEGQALVDSSIPNDANRGTWAMELGLHSQLAGDTFTKNLGIYLASSHSGWLPTGVRNDVGILITGEDGWHHAIRYIDTNGSTVLFDVDRFGTVTAQAANFGAIAGTTTNNNAPAAAIGEYVSATVTFGAPVTFVSGVTQDIANITLTAGDWDVMFEPSILLGTTTNVTRMFTTLSTAANTINVAAGVFNEAPIPSAGLVNSSGPIIGLPIGPVRFSLAVTTLIFGNATCTFTVSNCRGAGVLRARRVR